MNPDTALMLHDAGLDVPKPSLSGEVLGASGRWSYTLRNPSSYERQLYCTAVRSDGVTLHTLTFTRRPERALRAIARKVRSFERCERSLP